MQNEVLEQFPFLQNLEYKEIIFQPDIHVSLAATVVNSNLPYKPGIYLVYNYSLKKIGQILYVGIAGSDKSGNINTHHLPKRLLAVTYPPDKYLNKILSKHPNRNDAWPIMMQIDNIQAIKICCFFSPIKEDFKVDDSKLPIDFERQINKILKKSKIKQPWSKRNKYEK
jgi:hypothetical protein